MVDRYFMGVSIGAENEMLPWPYAWVIKQEQPRQLESGGIGRRYQLDSVVAVCKSLTLKYGM
jgi:hypothetical protein